MHKQDRVGTIAPAWLRIQWKKLLAVLDDHPVPTLSVLGACVLLVGFYATQLHGLSHFRESFARWKVETFGGVHEVDRAVRMPDVILSFKPRGYDRLDAISMTSIHFGGIAFREELRELVNRGGLIRVVILDPRLSDPDSPSAPAFAKLASAFGTNPWVLREECWYSTAVILSLSEELGESFQVRLLSNPLPQAEEPYFSLGKSAHAYLYTAPNDRLDVIVPRQDPDQGLSSFAQPASVIIYRPEHPDVQKFKSAFEEAWEHGTVVDQSLYEELSSRAYATKN